MQRLVVCAGCSRHVRAVDRVCPHCGAELVSRSTAARRLGTAVVITASLVGPACGSSSGSDRNEVDNGSGGEVIEPGDVVIDMRNGNVPAVADAGPPPPPAVDAGPSIEVIDDDHIRPPMPYGAPPSRTRLV
jgi:predicted RNA-binding Zn-ribbon protein involved in translation (DUF1610 family)